jgi:prefoldin alpha subunit
MAEQIDPWSLSIEQLSSLKKQHEDEIAELQTQLQSLSNAKGRFVNSRNCIEDIAKSKEGDAMLVPLNSSLCKCFRFVSPAT